MSTSKPVTVTLKTSHTHAGVKYEAGSTLAVSQVDADWLVANGVAELPASDPAGDAKRDSKKA